MSTWHFTPQGYLYRADRELADLASHLVVLGQCFHILAERCGAEHLGADLREVMEADARHVEHVRTLLLHARVTARWWPAGTDRLTR